MNKRGKIFLTIVLFLFLGMSIIGLIVQRSIEMKFYDAVPDEVTKLGMDLLEALEEKDHDFVISNFVDEFKEDSKAYKDVESLSDFLADVGDYIGKDIVGYHISNMNGVVYYKMTYEIEYINSYVRYSFILTDVEGGLKAHNINLNVSDISLKEYTRFTFKDKTVLHYLIFLLTIISLLFSLVTAAICFSTDKRKRVLWSLFCLTGVGVIAFVWSSGEMTFNLLSIGFPTGGFGKSGYYGPLVFSFRFPIGACLYWLIKHDSKELSIEEVFDQVEEDIEKVE